MFPQEMVFFRNKDMKILNRKDAKSTKKDKEIPTPTPPHCNEGIKGRGLFFQEYAICLSKL